MAQHPPDILHGIWNMLFTVVIPVIENLFMDDLQWTATTTQQFLENSGMENVSGDDPEKEARFTRSIDHALDFMRKRHWKTIVEAMYLPNKQLMHNGTMRDIHTLIKALFIHILTVLDAAHKPEPLSDQQVALVEAACEHTRQLLVTLNAKGTVWGHVWVYHVPQFFQKWKIMFPFLGYGVEGRHRALKQEIRRSARGQWRGAILGFVYVVGSHWCNLTFYLWVRPLLAAHIL